MLLYYGKKAFCPDSMMRSKTKAIRKKNTPYAEYLRTLAASNADLKPSNPPSGALCQAFIISSVSTGDARSPKRKVE